jgi:glycosyltransferase involved in cell wall biosynthesis
MTRLSVIVLSKNNASTIDACLRSVVEAQPREKQIVAVDANSTDGTQKILDTYGEKIEVVRDEGAGIGIARNVGIANAKGEVICFVDADARVAGDHFAKILRIFDENPRLGILSVGGFRSEMPDFTEVQRLESEFVRVWDEVGERSGRYSPLRSKGGAFMSFRKACLDDVGEFWSFPPFGSDDSDYVLRSFAKGWGIERVYTGSVHYHRRTIPELVKQKYTWGKGRSCYIKKHQRNPILVSTLGRKPHLVTILARLVTPLTILRRIRYMKTWKLIPYAILRQYSNLVGYMVGWFTWARKINTERS